MALKRVKAVPRSSFETLMEDLSMALLPFQKRATAVSISHAVGNRSLPTNRWSMLF